MRPVHRAVHGLEDARQAAGLGVLDGDHEPDVHDEPPRGGDSAGGTGSPRRTTPFPAEGGGPRTPSRRPCPPHGRPGLWRGAKMGWATAYIAKLQHGETVQFR